METAQEISPHIISVRVENGTGMISKDNVITQGIRMIVNNSVLSIKVENITAIEAKMTMATNEISRAKRFLPDVL